MPYFGAEMECQIPRALYCILSSENRGFHAALSDRSRSDFGDAALREWCVRSMDNGDSRTLTPVLLVHG